MPGLGAETVNGRPLVNLTISLNYALGGLNPAGYHLFNIGIHALAALILYGLLGKAFQLPRLFSLIQSKITPRTLAFAVTLLWALHPLQSLTVIYIIQRAESLAGLFLFLTLYAFLKATTAETHKKSWPCISIIACFLGVASKEIMYAAPLLVLLFDRIFVSASWGELITRRKIYYAFLFSSWLLLGVLVLSSWQRGNTVGTGISAWHYLLTQCHALFVYLKLAIWPNPLIFDYGTPLKTSLPDVILQASLLLIMFMMTVRWVAKSRPGGFCGALFFLILAPSSSIIPIATQTMAEYRMYVPLVAVILVISFAVVRLTQRASFVILFALVSVWGALTYARTLDYASETSIWTDTVHKCPENIRAQSNLATALSREGKFEDALVHYNKAAALFDQQTNPAVSLAGLYYNIGNTFYDLNKPSEAIEAYRKGLALDNESPERTRNEKLLLYAALARVFVGNNRPQDALPCFTEIITLKPDDAAAHVGLGNALLQLRRESEAATVFEQAVTLNPNLVEAHANLGMIYGRQGETSRALASLENAASLAPQNHIIQCNLGMALLQSGQISAARKRFEKALLLKPAYAPARDILRQLDESFPSQ